MPWIRIPWHYSEWLSLCDKFSVSANSVTWGTITIYIKVWHFLSISLQTPPPPSHILLPSPFPQVPISTLFTHTPLGKTMPRVSVTEPCCCMLCSRLHPCCNYHGKVVFWGLRLKPKQEAHKATMHSLAYLPDSVPARFKVVRSHSITLHLRYIGKATKNKK